jgi:hypothetical protein
MKAKLLTLVCAAVLLLGPAATGHAENTGFSMIADFLIIRPACLVATVAGSAFFVVSLPIAAISNSVKESAHALVVVPARATFTRPLGDVDALTDY